MGQAWKPLLKVTFCVIIAWATPSDVKLDPVSRVTGIPGWYWILESKCSYTTSVRLVYWNSELKSDQGHTLISKHRHAMQARVIFSGVGGLLETLWVVYSLTKGKKSINAEKNGNVKLPHTQVFCGRLCVLCELKVTKNRLYWCHGYLLIQNADSSCRPDTKYRL